MLCFLCFSPSLWISLNFISTIGMDLAPICKLWINDLAWVSCDYFLGNAFDGDGVVPREGLVSREGLEEGGCIVGKREQGGDRVDRLWCFTRV